MVVRAIDERDARELARKDLAEIQSTETRADHDNVWNVLRLGVHN
jgi:hypothetical protein